MRAIEFIHEGQTTLSKSAKASIKGAMSTPDANNNAGDAYKQYRFGIALAGAPEFPTQASNVIAGDPLLCTYTDEELAMVNFAASQSDVGKVKRLTANRSEERSDTAKNSTVATIKRNKYGV